MQAAKNAMAPRGTLKGTAISTVDTKWNYTHAIRNTHLHVVPALIAPPIIGPKSNDKAMAMDRFAVYFG